jgi:hypothetical protein
VVAVVGSGVRHGPRGVGSGAGAGPEERHRRALLLGEIAAEGPPGLARVLRRAAAGDADAASMPVTALVHAAPGMTALDGHQLLRRAHIRERDLAGEITPDQRVALLELVDRTDRLRHAIQPGPVAPGVAPRPGPVR